MNEVLLAGAIIAIVLLIAIAVWLLETRHSCRHKFGTWCVADTEEAYVQFRQCEKCNYTEREQWRKIKEKK